jgi:hypothetical protein
MNITITQVGDSPLYHQVLHIHLFKDCVFAKANLDNHDGLTNSREYI